MKKLGVTVIALIGVSFSSGSFASPTLCSGGDPNADGMSVSDVTWNGGNADDCYGVNEGNVDVADANAAWGASFGSGNFTFVLKREASGGGTGSFGGLDFTLDADIQQKFGVWDLSWVCNGNCSATLDVVVGLKASNNNGLWLFDDIAFADQGSDKGAGSGTFVINFESNGGTNPALSNMVLLMREGTEPPPVSEPGSLALLAMSVAGVFFGRKANSRKRGWCSVGSVNERAPRK